MVSYCRLGPFGAQVNLDTKIGSKSYTFTRTALKDISQASDYPFSAGERVKIYDTLGEHHFNLVWKTAYLGGDQETLERLMRIGESWQFDLYEELGGVRVRDRRSVVYIDDISEGYLEIEGRRVAITLKDAYRRILSDCDSLTLPWGPTAWWCSAGGGVTSVETTLIKEGTGSIKTTRAALPIATTLAARLNPATHFDSTAFKWVGFWYRTTETDDITIFRVYFHTAPTVGYYYHFHGLVPAENTWYFIRIPRSSFTKAGAADWSDIVYVTIDCVYTVQHDVTFYIDEFCLIE